MPRSATLRRFRWVAFVLSLVLVGCGGREGAEPFGTAARDGAAAGFEALPVLHVRDALPPELQEGASFTVDRTVRNDGFLNHYTVRVGEPRTVMQVAGTELLRQRVAELDAVAWMREIKTGETYREASAHAATAPVRLARAVITSPSAPIADVGPALIGAPGGADDALAEMAADFGAVKRTYAHRLGIDPYSRNPLLQAELDDLAWAGFATGGAAATEPAGEGPGGRIAALLRDNGPAGLAALNGRELRALGASENATRALLANPHYTPTDQTRLTVALGRLAGVEGRGLLVERAAVAPGNEVASLLARHAEMLAAYHERMTPLARFVRWGAQALPVDREGRLVAAFPLDHVIWSERLAALLGDDNLPTGRNAPRLRGRQLWITGEVSPLARVQLEAAGWTVHERAGERLGL